MSTTVYFDCFAGASGDMLLAALLDAGAPLTTVRRELAKLPLLGLEITTKKVQKQGLSALDVTISSLEKDPPCRSYTDIEKMLTTSTLSAPVRRMSLKIFRRLAVAEGKVHNRNFKDIHFHEVGAADSIADIVGTAVALEALEAENIYASPLHVGTGFVTCAHGTLPVPAPATMELLQGIPVYAHGIKGELLTPTGAAILSSLSKGFGPLPSMRVIRTGYGAGKKELPLANILRVIIGEEETADTDREGAIILEAGIDDMNPEGYDYVMQSLFAAGAADVCLLPVQMKKNRPGIMLRILSKPENENDILKVVFSETTTLGVRKLNCEKFMLSRHHVLVQTTFGSARVKVACWRGKEVNVAPEHSDCLNLAQKNNIPLKKVYQEVNAAYLSGRGSTSFSEPER